MGRNNKFRGRGARYEHEDDYSYQYQDDRREDRPHNRHQDVPRFRDGRISRHKNKRGNRYNIERQIEEDINIGRDVEVDRRPQGFRRGPKIPGLDMWYKIMVKNVKASKDTVLKTIIAMAPVTVIPFYWNLRGPHAFFYVETQEMANAIIRLNITLPDGEKLEFGHIQHGPMPNIPVDEGMQLKLRQVLQRRYDAQGRSLDLSNFHYDESLCHEYYVPLTRPFNMKEVMRIVVEHIPELRSLDLSQNKLLNIDSLEVLVDKSVELKALNLADNKIQNLAVFTKIKSLPLETLMLAGNPVTDRLMEKGTDHYRSEIRRVFPKVLTLDSESLPPPVTFDVEPEVLKAPPTQETFLVNDGAKEILQTFLHQYYTLYDQDRRSELVHAYHDDAIFSLTSGLLPKGEDNQARLGLYLAYSRNLMRVKDSSVRVKSVRRGKAEVVELLQKLPKSEHDPSSFRVDVTVFTPGLMSINLKGVFREELDKKKVLRSFMRFLTLVPVPSGGFCITNDLLFVTNASQAQIKTAFKQPEIPIVPQPGPSTSASAPSVQEEMIVQFSNQSGMNLEFSRQCLESRNWDYQAAAELFQQMVAANAIPPDAFVR